MCFQGRQMMLVTGKGKVCEAQQVVHVCRKACSQPASAGKAAALPAGLGLQEGESMREQQLAVLAQWSAVVLRMTLNSVRLVSRLRCTFLICSVASEKERFISS